MSKRISVIIDSEDRTVAIMVAGGEGSVVHKDVSYVEINEGLNQPLIFDFQQEKV